MDEKPRTVFSDIRNRGHDEDFSGPLPAQATDIRPGSARVAILMARAERGEELWHPDDVNDYESDERPVLPELPGNKMPIHRNWRKEQAPLEAHVQPDPEAGEFKELKPDAI